MCAHRHSELDSLNTAVRQYNPRFFESVVIWGLDVTIVAMLVHLGVIIIPILVQVSSNQVQIGLWFLDWLWFWCKLTRQCWRYSRRHETIQVWYMFLLLKFGCKHSSDFTTFLFRRHHGLEVGSFISTPRTRTPGLANQHLKVNHSWPQMWPATMTTPTVTVLVRLWQKAYLAEQLFES